MASLYNSLPNIAQASAPFRDVDCSVLWDLSTLLVKYGLTLDFGICLIHKHFDFLNDDELVADIPDKTGESTVSSVFKDLQPDGDIVAKYNLQVPCCPQVVGSRFLLTGTDIIPYEFSC